MFINTQRWSPLPFRRPILVSAAEYDWCVASVVACIRSGQIRARTRRVASVFGPGRLWPPPRTDARRGPAHCAARLSSLRPGTGYARSIGSRPAAHCSPRRGRIRCSAEWSGRLGKRQPCWDSASRSRWMGNDASQHRLKWYPTATTEQGNTLHGQIYYSYKLKRATPTAIKLRPLKNLFPLGPLRWCSGAQLSLGPTPSAATAFPFALSSCFDF